ncbi:VOC family protein [Chitinophaga sp.]|uniref:VOC family protein n=1 Tax=Chitinophaga sp. TaxID=1869181 RepID=UPI0031E43FFA
MILSSIRIITADIQGLVKFYEGATGLAFKWFTEDFAELRTTGAALAIGSTRTLALFGGNVAEAAHNRSVIIEFRVDDVDAASKRIPAETIVQQPTTMPWGNRSLLFRDPDGNLVNFFTPVTEDAKKRFA